MASGRDTPSSDHVIHATTVAFSGRAALIQGRSGSGKTILSWQLIALGAKLIADDRTHLHKRGPHLIAECPPAIRGQIEARGIGILVAPLAAPTSVGLVIDMDSEETERLPPWRTTQILGVTLPLQRKVGLPHFPAAILSYLEHGRSA